MSTLLEERPEAPRAASARPGTRGPLWLVVRQHRTTLLIGAAVMVAGALALIAYRIWAGNLADDFAATGCDVTGTDRRPDCFTPASDFSDRMYGFDRAVNYGSYALQFLPGLLAAFVAGPMVARELESGTYRLAWTQSVSPARWLASKLSPLAVAVLVLVPPLTAVRAWVAASVPDNSPYPRTPWHEPTTFVSLGTAPVAYALLGIAAGALVGLLIARTLPAMSAALLAVGGAFLAMNQVRAHLWPSATATSPLDGYPRPGGTWWWLDEGLRGADGDRLPDMACSGPYEVQLRCLAEHGAAARYIDLHPASHFWPLQLVESGIVLALAAACAFAAFKVLGRRHG
ncbi:hypothetical protein [Streptomyces sp. NPDC058653]|uniref:hypothetical protein n=1 Tax=Streptomyces sp. NPDC058653 TaxID=3346576 RepID=UPI0036529055